MNFSEAIFYENYLTSDFHTNTVISRRVCLPVEMASKTVIRSIGSCLACVCRVMDAREKFVKHERRFLSALQTSQVQP